MSDSIVTYNVLCSSESYSSPSSFPACVADFLNPVHRLRVLKTQLLRYIQEGTIICLQEVTETWYSELFVFFTLHNYAFLHSGYSNHWADYMGCSIAYPMAKYAAQTVKILHIGASIPLPFYKKKLEYIDRIPNDTIVYARGRPNTALMVAFDNGLCIANYHTPAAYWHPSVQPTITLHNVRFIIEAQEFAAGRPLVAVGDFNNIPNSVAYNMIRGLPYNAKDTYYPRNDLWYPKNTPEDDISKIEWAEGLEPMEDAREGFYIPTSHSIRTDFTDPEKPPTLKSLTIDYVFHTPNIVITKLEPIPIFTDDISLPTKINPSDHLPVCVHFANRSTVL